MATSNRNDMSSLQRLLSLDKGFDSLDQRVQEAARILDLSLDAPQPSSTTTSPHTPSTTTSPHSDQNTRLEFVLRWLLEQLKTQPDARQTPQLWLLLRLVLEHTNPSTLAKNLSGPQFLVTITNSLADTFPMAMPPTPQSTPDAPQTSKKRKRHSAVVENAPGLSFTIFTEIASLLRILIVRTSPSPSASDAGFQSHMRALLRPEQSDLVRFTRHWFLGLLTLVPLNPNSTSFASSSLSILRDLLALQPVSSTNASDISFCTQCLWPATLLLRTLHTAPSPDSQHASQLLETFLAQHLFVPAKAAFYSAKESAKLPPKKRPQELPGLTERLAPLHAEMAALSNTDKAQQHLLSLACACIPSLLDLASRCSPTVTPKQRIAEAPWIDLLFTALSDTFVSQTSVPVNEIIDQMLHVLLKKNLTLGSDLLSTILGQHSHLSGQDQKPDFSLVAKVLAMDSGLFTDVNTTNTNALFEALSKYEESDTVENGPKLRTVCHEIVVPLMEAYSRTRNLPSFLDRWSRCLQAQASVEEYGPSLWTDSSLQDSLRQLLETSLTSTQIAEILDIQRVTLDKSFSPTPDLGQGFASSVLLDFIVGALRTDATTVSLMSNFESLIGTVEEVFSHLPQIGNFRTKHLLSLLTRLYDLWFPTWSVSQTKDEVEAKSSAIIGGPAAQYAKTRTLQFLEKPDAETDYAFAFIVSICDLKRRLSHRQEEVVKLFGQASFKNAEGNAASSYASQRPGAFIAALTGFPSLLSSCIDPSSREAFLMDVFEALSGAGSLSQSLVFEFMDDFFATGDFAVRDNLLNMQCGMLHEKKSISLTLEMFLRWPLKALSRQQRERVLDLITSPECWQGLTGGDKQRALVLMASLLEVPNATAEVAVKPSAIWKIADTNFDVSELDAFEDVCTHLFRHILDTKEQDRSKAYVNDFSKLASKFVNKEKDLAITSAPGKLRLLTAFFDVTETRLDEDVLSDLPHRSPDTIDTFVKRLHEVLSELIEENYKSDDVTFVKLLNTVEAFARTPASLISAGGSSTKKYSKRLVKQLKTFLNTSGAVEENVPLTILIHCFEQLCSEILEENSFELCITAEQLLARDLDARQHHIVTDSFTKSTRVLSNTEKISLIERLIPAGEPLCTAERVILVRCIVSSLHIRPKDESTLGAASIFVRLLMLLKTCSDYNTHRQLTTSVIAVLRDQPNLVTQYSAELTIAVTISLASPSSPLRNTKRASSIFESLCSISQSLLQFHRSSLGGRFDVLIPLMQRLMACLFLPGSRDAGTANRFKHPPWIDTSAHSLTVKHSQKFSRLLENLCNPPQSSVTGNRGKTSKSTPDLVDETRKARMHVAQHAPHILHYLCTLILNGRLGEGMRDALTPGMWAVIDVAEIGADDARGVKALSSSMGNAERAVLRGIWEDWRRFGGAWKG